MLSYSYDFPLGEAPADAELISWNGEEVYAPAGEWITRFDGLAGSPEEQSQALQGLLDGAGLDARVDQYLGAAGTFKIDVTPVAKVPDLSAALAALPGCLYVVPNLLGSWYATLPDDTRFDELWGLNNTGQLGGRVDADIDAPEAWDLTRGHTTVAVGLLDSGVDITHPDLYLNIWLNQGEIPAGIRPLLSDTDTDGLITFRDLNRPQNAAYVADLNGTGYIDGDDLLRSPTWSNLQDDDGNDLPDDLVGWNFGRNISNPADEFGHGTHLAGTIGASGNNALGVAGVNWDVLIMPLGLGFSPTTASATAAMNYVATMRQSYGVHIAATNNSYGIGYSQGLLDAAGRMNDAGVLLVAAAGNTNSNTDVSPSYPANLPLPNVISVAATDSFDNKASFSNYGRNTVHLGAPGVNTLSTMVRSGLPLSNATGYGLLSGTSMAAPHVTGVAALAASLAANVTAQQIKDAILGGVDLIPALTNITVTGGRLNAFNTLQALDMSVGPVVTSFSPPGAVLPPVDPLRVTFDRPIDLSTFTRADIASFTDPNGVNIRGLVTRIDVVPGSDDRQFDIILARPLTRTGSYSITIGPSILDTAGNPMDQNRNDTPGEVPGDEFTATFRILGPRIIASTPANNARPLAPVGTVRVAFNEAMDTSTFTPDDVRLTGPGGVDLSSLVTDVTPVPGSGGTQFDVAVGPLTAVGTYTLAVGPDILDQFGNPMDQNNNLVPGEDPDDLFTTTFGILGPRITASTPANNARISPPVSSVRVTFNTSIDVATFTTADVILTGPGGPIPVTGIVVVGTSNTQFDITFAQQAAVGLYTLVVGPDVRDVFGNPMDQDNDLTPGENPDDQFRTTFGILGPRAIASTLIGTTFGGPISGMRMTFNRAMDVSTFNTADIVSLTGPGGIDLRGLVTGVFVVSGSGGTQFDVTFVPQVAVGTYTLVIGPEIRDLFGNPMDQNDNLIPGQVPADQFTASFAVRGTTDAFGYTGTVHPFQPIDLEPGQPGVFTIISTADDNAVQQLLGADSSTFNFYGTLYDRLFVSSNGLITFVSGNADLFNSDLTTSPAQAAIAVLWDDWIKTGGTPMVLGRFDDLNGDFVPDRMIIEWNDVRGFPSSPSGVTFQAILGLNTGPLVPGEIILNYPDLDSGDSRSNGGSATVGIKAAGTQGGNRLLVAFNESGPFVGGGRALRFAAPPIGGQIRGVKFHDLDRDGVHDPNEPGLAGWTVYLDLNQNGAPDPFEPSTVTDVGGNYAFTDVAPGSYFVREVLQPGWVRTLPNRAGEDILVNGSFETGTFAGWTVNTTGTPFLPWAVSRAGAGSGFGMAPTSPQDGSFDAWNGFDGAGPMEFTMYQDVTIGAGAPATLEWRDRVQWDFTISTVEATLPRIYQVQIRNPSTNDVLSTLYSFSTGTRATNPRGDTGWLTHSVDLSAFAGSTIRLYFREQIPQGFTGPGQIEFDAIRLLSVGDFYRVDLSPRQVATGRDFGNAFVGLSEEEAPSPTPSEAPADPSLASPDSVDSGGDVAFEPAPAIETKWAKYTRAAYGSPETWAIAEAAGPRSPVPQKGDPASAGTAPGDLVDLAIASAERDTEEGGSLAGGLTLPKWWRPRGWAGVGYGGPIA